jgi:hypothetical protein
MDQEGDDWVQADGYEQGQPDDDRDAGDVPYSASDHIRDTSVRPMKNGVRRPKGRPITPSASSPFGVVRERLTTRVVRGGGPRLEKPLLVRRLARGGSRGLTQLTRAASPLMASVADASEHRLEGLLSVTDSALTTLKIEEFLTELQKRVHDVGEADTAAVPLLDEESDELIATAACGIEEEVRVGVRVRSGEVSSVA